MTNFTAGDISENQTLTDDDHLYPDHISELRQSTGATAVVGQTSKCEYYCDGVADDVQIQAAIDALPSGGGKVLIREGIYAPSSTINITKNYVTIEGVGHSTRFEPASDLDVFNVTAHGVQLKNFYCGSGSGKGNITFNGNRREDYIENVCMVGDLTFQNRLATCFASDLDITGDLILDADTQFVNNNVFTGIQIRAGRLHLRGVNYTLSGNQFLGLTFIGDPASGSEAIIYATGANVDANHFYGVHFDGIDTDYEKYNFPTGCILNTLVASTSNDIDGSAPIGNYIRKMINATTMFNMTDCELNEGYEEINSGTVNLKTYGTSRLHSSVGAITATLPDATAFGVQKLITMTNATNSSTVSATHHETSDPEVGTFNAVDEYWLLVWTGTEWATISNSCTFV